MSRASGQPPAPKRWAAAHGRACFDSLGRLWRQPLASLLSIAVLGLTLALPTALQVLLHNLDGLGAGWQQGVRISVLLADDAGDERLGTLAGRIGARGDVARVEALTADEALAEFERESGLADAVALLPDNPLPATLTVTPADGLAADKVQALRDALAGLDGVDEVLLDTQWLQRLSALLALLERAVLIFAGALGAAVLVIVGNTIGLEVASRREEIEVMKLVGAPDAFIRRPFLYSGLWYGLIGGLVALVLVGIALLALDGAVARLAGAYGSAFTLTGPDTATTLSVIAGGCVLGWIGALIAVGRRLRAIEPA
ncbi:permease-like cell division protein FtsX [Algiphilus sp.]|uniref:permease-like cell division protein FtsX n=2 Tax=Algiphilus sp. TaxID=1872431 RepID=UPI0025BAFECB|nr:permease-like cell division protein FtsX [Algiphilus sp.]MCK5771264.1 permease-like cell division protein FtsX [Algiphilus sp.]